MTHSLPERGPGRAVTPGPTQVDIAKASLGLGGLPDVEQTPAEPDAVERSSREWRTFPGGTDEGVSEAMSEPVAAFAPEPRRLR
jgi:hypothetical protein